jgi:hypothetical protein
MPRLHSGKAGLRRLKLLQAVENHRSLRKLLEAQCVSLGMNPSGVKNSSTQYLQHFMDNARVQQQRNTTKNAEQDALDFLTRRGF